MGGIGEANSSHKDTRISAVPVTLFPSHLEEISVVVCRVEDDFSVGKGNRAQERALNTVRGLNSGLQVQLPDSVPQRLVPRRRCELVLQDDDRNDAHVFKWTLQENVSLAPFYDHERMDERDKPVFSWKKGPGRDWKRVEPKDEKELLDRIVYLLAHSALSVSFCTAPPRRLEALEHPFDRFLPARLCCLATYSSSEPVFFFRAGGDGEFFFLAGRNVFPGEELENASLPIVEQEDQPDAPDGLGQGHSGIDTTVSSGVDP